MGNCTIIESIVEGKLLELHTAFIGRVVESQGGTASVQPLGGIKARGEPGKKRALLTGVPVINSARYKWRVEPLTYVTAVSGGGSTSVTAERESREVAVPVPLGPGDLVVCVCGERSIAQTRWGMDETPTPGRHSLSDAIVVGVLG